MSSQAVRILVVDEDPQRGAALAAALQGHGYTVVGRFEPGDYLPSLVADAQPDVILIDIGSPSRDTLEQLSVIHRDQPRPVVMFAANEEQQVIEAAIRAGVSAYIVDGISQAKVKPIIDVAIAHFHQHQALREELERTRTSLADRKMVDRAKGILIDRYRCTEEQAYARLRKMAMDRKKKLGELARDIVEMASLFRDEPATDQERDYAARHTDA